MNNKEKESKKQLNWIPSGKANGESLARGIEKILTYLGHDVDYDTIMGDSGRHLSCKEKNAVQILSMVQLMLDGGLWNLWALTSD